MQVELLKMSDYNTRTGIGRQVISLLRHMPPEVGAYLAIPRLLPMSDRVTPLKLLPIGVSNHCRGNILHIPQIMGCALQLWNPVRPSVATIHDLGFMDFPDEWKMLDPITRQVLRLSLAGLKRFQWYIAVSEFTRQSMIKHLGIDSNCITIINPGIDHDCFLPADCSRAAHANHIPDNVKNSFPLLLYVGTEIPRKNFSVLLEVVARLSRKYPNIKLIKIGSAGGEQFRKATLKIIQSLGLEDAVILFDSITDADLRMFYSCADIFVTASKLEGFGLPVLEAMACGTPVVCSDAGSLTEVGGEAAAFVKADDIDGWCSVICEIIDNYDRSREMVAMGLAQAQKFSWKAAAQQTAEVYKALAQST